MPDDSVPRVLLVDPSEAFTEGIASCLASGEHEVVGQVRSCAISLKELDRLHSSLILLGPHLADDEAFAMCRAVTTGRHGIHVVLFHHAASDLLVQADAIEAGAAACLSVEVTCQQCLDVLAVVIVGLETFPRDAIYQSNQPIDLTAREREVLRHMSNGESYSEVARTLGISTATVRNHAQRIIEKLAVHSREQAAARARRRGLI
jgi:DNA-binding NarL/FixJ family response regulator